jgi:streptogramin lyase
VGATLPATALVLSPTASLTVTYSAPYNPATVGTDDLTLSQGTVTGVSLVDATTVAYSLGGLAEGAMSVTLPAGAVADTAGDPVAAFTNTYTVDVGTAPFNGAFQASAPLGSLAYQGTATGQFNSTAVFVPAGSGGISHSYCPAFGPDGKLYVVGNFSDNVERYDPTTGAYLDTFIPAGSGGLANPTQIAFGPDGNLYITSNNNNSVMRYNGTTGAFIDVFVASGSGGLSAPTGLAFGPDGDLYVVSRFTDSVLRYNGTTGAYKGAFISSGSGGLNEPGFLQWGPDGNVYVTSAFTNSILRYNGTTGAFLNAFVPSGSGGLDTPNSLLFGPDGNLYVATAYADSVLRYNGTTGAFVGTYVPSGAGGLNFPVGMTFGPDGALYVGSADNNQVLRFDGTSGGPGDVDSYTLDLDANQTLALQITAPAGTTVTATHSVLGAISLGPDLDPGPGQQYQAMHFTDAQGNPVAGTVTLTLQAPNGLSADSYSIQATLNAQFDTGSDGSAPAQSLAPSLLDVEPGPVAINRAAALGSVEKSVARVLSETEGVTNDLRGSWDQVGTSTTWSVNNSGNANTSVNKGVTGSLNATGSSSSKGYDPSDTYSFYGRAGDVVTLRTRGSNSGGGTLTATTLRLQGAGAQVSGSAVPGAASDALIQSFTLPGTGTYTVTVGAPNGKKGTYTLTADLVTPANPRPNTADVYSFTVNAGEYLSAAVATGGSAVSSAQVQLALYAPGVDPLTGTALKTSGISGSLDGLLEYQATTAGTYEVKVSGGPGLTTASTGYTLVTTSNGSFNNTADGTFATAQDITGRPGVVGNLSASVSPFITAGTSGLSGPNGVVLGPDGNWYVSSLNSNQVLRYSGSTGAFLNVFVKAGSGGLSAPAGLTFGPDGNLYVSSTSTNQVLRYNGSTGASLGVFAAAPSLTRPDGLAFRGDGYLYVVGNLSYNIVRFDASTGAYAGDFVPVGSGGMSHPEDLAFGPDGNLYVSNYTNNSVLRYSGTDGSFLGTFVTSGSGGLSAPAGLRFGPDGNLYVVSRFGNAVLHYDGSTGAFLDAFIPASAGLNTPTFLAWASDGALYVSSASTNSVFRKALAPPPDYDKVTLTAGQTVTFSTSTPGDGPGQPVNQLSPTLGLYNPSQVLVATGTTLSDGRNEAITYTVPTSGTYYVKVSGQNLTGGDYVLDPVEEGESAPGVALEAAWPTDSFPAGVPPGAALTDQGPGPADELFALPSGLEGAPVTAEAASPPARFALPSAAENGLPNDAAFGAAAFGVGAPGASPLTDVPPGAARTAVADAIFAQEGDGFGAFGRPFPLALPQK